MGCTDSKIDARGCQSPLSGTTQSGSSKSTVYSIEELEMMKAHRTKVSGMRATSRLREPKEERMPEVVGGCQIGELLGRGSWAEVYLGVNDAAGVAGMQYAVKSFSKNRVGKRELETAVKKEVQLLRRLKAHPNIVSLMDVHEDMEWFHMVLDYAGGGTLQQRIRMSAGGRLDTRTAVEYFADLMTGVEYIHSMGVCHRDIKPANLLLDGSKLLVSDFGLSEANSGTLTTCCGTPDYMAPEILEVSRGARLGYNGAAADIWSCGVTFYAMLCGKTPWVHATREFRENEIITAVVCYKKLAHVPEKIRDVVAAMLMKESRERPTAREMLFGQ